MATDSHRIMLMGLEASGKTTYLAALWHLIEANAPTLSLSSDTLPEERQYLNGIRSSWLRLEPVPRTTIQEPKSIDLKLKEKESGQEFEMHIPDISGESYRHQFTDRFATITYSDLISNMSGILLFIHPEQIRKPERIKPTAIVESVSTAHTNYIEWHPDLTPTQIILVDLLQFVHSLSKRTDSLKISIMISAWDRIKSNITPDAWLQVQLPLLDQFLRSNSPKNPYRVFGLSAIGGALETQKSKLMAVDPLDRPILQVGSKGISHDLTVPLKHLLEEIR